MVCAGEVEHATGAWAGVMEPARAPAAHASLHTAHAWADVVSVGWHVVVVCIVVRVQPRGEVCKRCAASGTVALSG